MVIECNEIEQSINELLIAFQDCNKIKNSDLRKLVDLVAAVNTCANGGANYSTVVDEAYEVIVDTPVSYPIDTFHSISINVMEGSLEKLVGPEIMTFPSGSSLNLEVTTLNQTVYSFVVKANSKVYVQYITLTV
jgi:hypothetical protein